MTGTTTHGNDLLDQAFTRAAGAARVAGNRIRLLQDGPQNYPAWLDAIGNARESVAFENFIFCEDETGRQFAAALMERARAGVKVRLVYDWLGCRGRASRKFWRALQQAGCDVRVFNPPHAAHPVGWLQRDHRKLLSVDGRVGFISGLCIGRDWAGDAKSGREPWRDTGVQIEGPALADIEAAFEQVWAVAGVSLPAALAGAEPPGPALPPTGTSPAVGDVALRVVATRPGTYSVLRLDQLIAAAARRTLWLTDAYFAGIPPFVEALRAAARDGVDVRLLVPGSSDITLLRPLSQAGYRPLLEAGVRVFQWQGPMLHAKTAVADGLWARVGSSNLNLASWVGNNELDVLVEDQRFAADMQDMFEADLARATELVLRHERRRLGVVAQDLRSQLKRRRDDWLSDTHTSHAGQAAAAALRLSRTVGAALTERRVLATTDARLVGMVGLVALLLGVGSMLWPQLAAVPIALLLLWGALILFAKALALRRERRRRGLPTTHVQRDSRKVERRPQP